MSFHIDPPLDPPDVTDAAPKPAPPTAGLRVRRAAPTPGFYLVDDARDIYGWATDLSCDTATAEANARLWANSEALMRAAQALVTHWHTPVGEGVFADTEWSNTCTYLETELDLAVAAIVGEREAAR